MIFDGVYALLREAEIDDDELFADIDDGDTTELEDDNGNIANSPDDLDNETEEETDDIENTDDTNDTDNTDNETPDENDTENTDDGATEDENNSDDTNTDDEFNYDAEGEEETEDNSSAADKEKNKFLLIEFKKMISDIEEIYESLLHNEPKSSDEAIAFHVMKDNISETKNNINLFIKEKFHKQNYRENRYAYELFRITMNFCGEISDKIMQIRNNA